MDARGSIIFNARSRSADHAYNMGAAQDHQIIPASLTAILVVFCPSGSF